MNTGSVAAFREIVEVQFTPGQPAEEIHAAVHRIEERISGPYPAVSRIFIEVEAPRGAAAEAPAS